MDGQASVNSAGAMVERLVAATNAHDLDALEACFAPDYVNETPAHPARGFSGREQVRRNWEQIFRGVPDISSTARWVADGDTVWSEFEMSGTRLDGAAHHMAGVVIFGVRDGVAAWARFYLEPVDHSTDDVNATVRRALQQPQESAS
jgi:ketosteroid isomerase-like protein